MNLNLKDSLKYSSGGITSKVIHKSEKSNVTLFLMAAGTDLSEHTATKEGLVYVIEGKGTFVLDGKLIKILPGTFIAMSKNTPHSLEAEENTAFLLTLVN